MGNLIVKIWSYLDGWKSVISYVALQIPWLAEHPLVVDAVQQVIVNSDPSTAEGAKAWGNLFVQLLLLTGIVSIVTKNVKYGTTRLGQVMQPRKNNVCSGGCEHF